MIPSTGKTRIGRCRISDIGKTFSAKENILNTKRKRRLNWFDHVTRRDSDSYVRRGSSRQRGTPKRWDNQIRHAPADPGVICCRQRAL